MSEEGLSFKLPVAFTINFAKLWFGSGPFHLQFAEEENESSNEEKVSISYQTIYFEMKVKNNGKLRRLLGKRPATALLYRHQTGFKKNADGEIIRGELNIADLSEEDERVVSVEVVGLLNPFTFDQIASAIIEGGRELLAKAALTVQLKGDRDKIGEIAKPGNMFLLEDLVVSFEIGEKFDEFSCDD